ncbi:protein ILRUN-like [Branchiostoma lanceolatum]|uniref:Protein ILRUN n=1 Tax=Branchiostoma lanceolatum TaxID=7740 RepID=A0A8J9ZLZ3_BRALA|nr:C6orf106 [Branchiostoma lanceolatum]
MEVDQDLEADFMQKFSAMGTTDREVLVAELQKLVNYQLNPSACAFFLDMNNWNLQAAVGAFYDLETPRQPLPNMSFVADITIGEGESVPPDTQFVKTWRIQNSGEEPWPAGSCLRFLAGERLGPNDRVLVDSLDPRGITDVSVNMVSPSHAGVYHGQWRMCTPANLYFGEIIWVILTVEENGLLAVTQQMSSMGADLATSLPLQGAENPFGRPPPGSQSNDQPQTLFGSPHQSGALPQSPFNSPVKTGPSESLPHQQHFGSPVQNHQSEVASQNAVVPSTQSQQPSHLAFGSPAEFPGSTVRVGERTVNGCSPTSQGAGESHEPFGLQSGAAQMFCSPIPSTVPIFQIQPTNSVRQQLFPANMAAAQPLPLGHDSSVHNEEDDEDL